ncbi:Replicase large subunit [Frankliniella fusca]|uniref:Replicase large subunit n=1 Tax=Frankliniella fusca TaxID=407009 RepID=A0AAE1LH89_9NEOP|nr:Replicase large subunit [Frankliniella fusca]
MTQMTGYRIMDAYCRKESRGGGVMIIMKNEWIDKEGNGEVNVKNLKIIREMAKERTCDFNVNFLNLKEEAMQFKNPIKAHNIRELVEEGTRWNDNGITCLDNILTNRDCSEFKITILGKEDWKEVYEAEDVNEAAEKLVQTVKYCLDIAAQSRFPSCIRLESETHTPVLTEFGKNRPKVITYDDYIPAAVDEYLEHLKYDDDTIKACLTKVYAKKKERNFAVALTTMCLEDDNYKFYKDGKFTKCNGNLNDYSSYFDGKEVRPVAYKDGKKVMPEKGEFLFCDALKFMASGAILKSVKELPLVKGETVVIPPISACQGVPGSGKSHTLIQNVVTKQGESLDFIVVTGREQKQEIEARLEKQRYPSPLPVATCDSVLINHGKYGKFVGCDRLFIDEVFVHHAGKVLILVSILKPKTVHVLGDNKQVIFINRRGEAPTPLARVENIVRMGTPLNVSHRIPLDAVCAISDQYEFPVFGTSDIVRSIEWKQSGSITDYVSEDVKILVHKQIDKIDSRIKHFQPNTIQEYQGNQHDHVVGVESVILKHIPILYEDGDIAQEILASLDIQVRQFYYYLEKNIAANSDPYLIPNTNDQAKSPTWKLIKSFLATASNAHRLLHLASDKAKMNFLLEKLWSLRTFTTNGMKYGMKNESTAREAYVSWRKKTDASVSVEETGLWVKKGFSYLGCSPDGIIHADGKSDKLLEIKCLKVLKKSHPKNFQKCLNKRQLSRFPLTEDSQGTLRLKTTHPHYYQVQMALEILGMEECDYFIWSPKGHITATVTYDPLFWGPKLIQLSNIHGTLIIPEYFLQRTPRRLPPITFKYDEEEEEL